MFLSVIVDFQYCEGNGFSVLSFALTVGILGCLILIATYIFISINLRLVSIVHDPRNRIIISNPVERVAMCLKGRQQKKSMKVGEEDCLEVFESKYELHLDNAADYERWQVNWSEVELQSLIGTGRFGEIYSGKWCGTEVAVKIPIPNNNVVSKQAMASFHREIRIMALLHHPNIVMFLGGSLDPKCTFVLMEYCQLGSLSNFIRSPVGAEMLSPPLVHKFVTDIARGMKYLHSRAGIIQRDLKSANLLVDSNHNIKVADFGMSKHVNRSLSSSNQRATSTVLITTPYWTAPEVIRREGYTTKSDVYSFAVVMWELASKRFPFDGRSDSEVMYAVAQGERLPILATWPSYYVDLMKRCWQDNPMNRPTFAEILEELFEMYQQDRNLRRIHQARQ